MKQVIEWKKIDWDKDNQLNVPHREHCYFIRDNSPYPEFGDIVTGHYQCYDGKWVIIEINETTVRVPLLDFTHYAEVEE